MALLPKNMTILPPKKAIPILLDRQRSPVVSFDTEFDASRPTCQADLRGLSLASGNRLDGYIGTFFSFANGLEEFPWTYVRDRVLAPVFGDEHRRLVMHPPKTDMQLVRARGLRDVRAQIECTFSMVHLFDENLPKGLKDLGEALLGVHGLKTHAQTVAEMRKIRKAGEKEAKAIIKQAWEVYRDERKRSKEEEVDIDPNWPSWKRIAMRLPPKLKKVEVVARLGDRIKTVVESKANRRAAHAYAYYGALDALLTIGIRDLMLDGAPGIPGLKQTEQYKHLDLETQVCHPVVTEMEEHGCVVNVELLRDIHAACAKAITELEDELRKRWAPALNREGDPEWKPGSFEQIGEIIWNRWGLRPPPWTQSHGEIKPSFRIAKTGLCSTKDEVLTYVAEKTAGKHADDIRLLLNWRGFTKIFGTYVEPMLGMVLADPENRIHAAFWPVGARTGRFSSSDPNLENIPRPFTMPTLKIPPGADPLSPPPGVKVEGKGDKLKWRVKSLRDIFIAPKGRKLVSADLAQIENRLIAHESQDPTLLMLFRKWDCAECGKSGETNVSLHACPACGAPEDPDGKGRDKTQPDQPAVKGFCLGRDIHAMTAHRLGLVEKHGFKEGRQRAKADNHAYNYGMGARTLARREGMSVGEAQSHLDGLDQTYPYVRQRLHKRVKRGVKQDGVVTMFDGHVRRFLAPRLLMQTDNFRQWEWEGVIREAVNVLAQGGTGVIMKRAMIAIRNRIQHEDRLRGKVWLINQIHDELLYEAEEDVADYMLQVIIEELEKAAPELSVPVIAEGGVGNTWGEIH